MRIERIIAEIPPSETATRSALAQLLGVSIHAAGGKAIFFDGARAVKVTVEGMAFDDASHWSKANPKSGHAHGSGRSPWPSHPSLSTTSEESLLSHFNNGRDNRGGCHGNIKKWGVRLCTVV